MRSNGSSAGAPAGAPLDMSVGADSIGLILADPGNRGFLHSVAHLRERERSKLIRPLFILHADFFSWRISLGGRAVREARPENTVDRLV